MVRDQEEVEHLRSVLREIAFMRPAGPNRNKWVARMERAALCALEWLDRRPPTQDIEAALAARKLEDQP